MNGYCKKEGTTLRMIIYKIGQPSVQSQLVIQKFINKPAHSVGGWDSGETETEKPSKFFICKLSISGISIRFIIKVTTDDIISRL
jgi:hypothetical protein